MNQFTNMNHALTSLCTVRSTCSVFCIKSKYELWGQTYGSRPHLICPCSQDPCHTSRSASHTPHSRNEILQCRTAPCEKEEELVARTRYHISPQTHQNHQRSPGHHHMSRDWARTLSCCSGTRAAHRWAESTSLHRCHLHSRRPRRTRRLVLNTCGYDTEILLLSRTWHLWIWQQTIDQKHAFFAWFALIIVLVCVGHYGNEILHMCFLICALKFLILYSVNSNAEAGEHLLPFGFWMRALCECSHTQNTLLSCIQCM